MIATHEVVIKYGYKNLRITIDELTFVVTIGLNQKQVETLEIFDSNGSYNYNVGINEFNETLAKSVNKDIDVFLLIVSIINNFISET